jgi:hypothetical protein
MGSCAEASFTCCCGHRACQTYTHKHLDQAVLAACGWPSDLSDEEILERLLALNLERSTGAEVSS